MLKIVNIEQLKDALKYAVRVQTEFNDNCTELEINDILFHFNNFEFSKRKKEPFEERKKEYEILILKRNNINTCYIYLENFKYILGEFNDNTEILMSFKIIKS